MYISFVQFGQMRYESFGAIYLKGAYNKIIIWKIELANPIGMKKSQKFYVQVK